MTSTKAFATTLIQFLIECVGAYFHTYESDTSFTTTTTSTISTSTKSTSFGPPSRDTDSPVPVELWHRNTRGRAAMNSVYGSNDDSTGMVVWVDNLKLSGLVLIPFSGMVLMVWCIKRSRHSEQPRSYMYEGDTVANTTCCEDPDANPNPNPNSSNHHRGSSWDCSRHGTNLNMNMNMNMNMNNDSNTTSNSNSNSNAFEYLEENEDWETETDTELECYCDLECKGNCTTTSSSTSTSTKTKTTRDGGDSPVVVVAIPTTIQPIATGTRTRTRTRTNARIVPSSCSSNDDKNENIDEESGRTVVAAGATGTPAMGVGGPDLTDKTLSTTAEVDSFEGSDSHTE